MKSLPSFRLDGQIALVTGAARGLGRAISLALAEAGATIGQPALPVQMDMADLRQIRAAIATVVERFGRLDILVNNTGIAPTNLALDVTEEDFDRTLAINVKGTFFACQAAGEVMKRQKSGRIINMSSQAGFVALPTESVYCPHSTARHLVR